MEFSLANVLYEEDSVGIFILVSVIMGGGGAWLAGRAIAATWRPWWQIVVYMLILAAAVRFIHFALFDGTLRSLHYYLVDAAVVLAIGLVGYRYTRANQMTTQYRWLYERAGPLTWREKPPSKPA